MKNKIRLRPIQYDNDLIILYSYMSDSCNQKLFSHKFQCNSLCAFERWLSEKLNSTYHDFFMIEKKDGTLIGFTFSYDYFENDRHCKFTLCLFEDYTKLGYGVLASIQMLDYLFSNYSLNQVFTTVFDYNHDSLSIHRHEGIIKVGELPNYRYHNGSYHALHIFSIEREVFYKYSEKLLIRQSE